jgi:hypothetical protein
MEIKLYLVHRRAAAENTMKMNANGNKKLYLVHRRAAVTTTQTVQQHTSTDQ